MSASPSGALIELDHVSRTFGVGKQAVKAVDGVSMAIGPSEIVCLVGESGCGKTTTGKIVAGLLPPTSGRVLFEGRDVTTLRGAEHDRYRRAIQIVHQDPYASLNPVRTVYGTLSPPLFRHGLARRREDAVKRIRELLQLVDMTPPDEFVDKYPHQLSGGQRQRVSIARALTVEPRFIVADEAVSMVDVSIRISLLNVLLRLRDRLGVGFLFITHDLALAKYFALHGRIGVMYLGRVVEMAPTDALIEEPKHPYSAALLSAIPEADPEVTRNKERVQLRSLDVPSLLNLPSGCTFHPRCPLFEEGLCEVYRPELVGIGGRREVSCHVVAREHGQVVAGGHGR
ncbi:MAG TPA: ABC transporter ATP-binding protein [Chloroflexota bacterium]|jgi:peptide/nickel transport system ATP-binding protein|nr:ABC transporter ATP-binding protein [Chloroflexota bacterium]